MILTGTGMVFNPQSVANTSLRLRWASISAASDWMDNLIGQTNIMNVSNWNTAFNLPVNGNIFSSVYIDPMDSDAIILAGGSDITTPDYLFANNQQIISVIDNGSLVALGGSAFAYSASFQGFSSTTLLTLGNAAFYSCTGFNGITAPLATSAGSEVFSGGTQITSIDLPNLVTAGNFCFNDTLYVASINLPSLTTAGYQTFRACGGGGGLTTISLPSLTTITSEYCFLNCYSVETFDLPLLQVIGNWCFSECYAAKYFNLSSCTNLGQSVYDNGVFSAITGNAISLEIPYALMTCSDDPAPGSPDGDIQYLQSLNTVTVINPIQIGSQTWTSRNLEVSTYANGDIIPEVTGPAAWMGATAGAWCYYNNDSANGAIYGKLYNWYAVNDPRGLAHTGWHIPSFDEYSSTLLAYLGSPTTAGGKMKETGTTHWNSPNTGATNSSGFTGLGGGIRWGDSGAFDYLKEYGIFWTSTENINDPTDARNTQLIYSGQNLAYGGGYGKKSGFSVRLVKGILKNGLSPASAGDSAYQIKTDYPASTDGLYWIKNPSINGGSPFQIYADMTTYGGGWTLIMQNNYDSWTTANGILRNQLTPPSTLATGEGSNSSENYSILAWADYLKSSPSGFQYMIDANTRCRYGGIWQANEAYSFVGIMDVAAYDAAGQNPDGSSAYFGTPDFTGVISGSNGFRQNITLVQKFPTDSGTWDYNNGGIESRMPWYDDINAGNPTIGNAVITTTHDDGGSWWGTLITNSNGGWHPGPWQSDVGMGSPGVIWYWVR